LSSPLRPRPDFSWLFLVAVLSPFCLGAEEPAAPAARAVVIPQVPRLWPLPPAAQATLDYAESSRADAWLRHPILGDPSFDSFQHHASNPFVRGEAPFQWPVNVSLLEDPRSGRWYAYVGHYLAGYDVGPGKPITHCRVYRSEDKGATWKHLGPIFADKSFTFDNDTQPANIAPDVSVLFSDGRYHMAYDWGTDNSTWATAFTPRDGADGGAGYAWAEQPEGPFHRAGRPIIRTSEFQRAFPSATKYRRPYGTSLHKRANDWLALTLVDSGPYFAWGQLAMTAKDPLGPWSAPVLVMSLEGGGFYPSPVEAFPAFVHGGYVYNPLTSVGANRNFQVILRAKLEDAHRPDAWELYQHGSAWHAAWAPHEGFGIWGQTFSGAVDAAGNLNVLFPSRCWPGGMGTINVASRKWDQPLRERGFVISAHSGPGLTLSRTAYRTFKLDAELALHGAAARIVWGYQAPLGNIGRADGKPHPLSWTRHWGLELTPAAWRLLRAGESGAPQVLAQGACPQAEKRTVTLALGDDGALEFVLDGARAWQGTVTASEGPLGLLLEPGTNLAVDRFAVKGVPGRAVWTWLASEALLGAGVNEGACRKTDSPLFRFHTGVVCTRHGERIKWNFRGRGFRLWLPKGPDYGRCTTELNGLPLGDLDLRAAEEQSSAVLLSREDLPDGFHALVVRNGGQPMPVDCLDALQ